MTPPVPAVSCSALLPLLLPSQHATHILCDSAVAAIRPLLHSALLDEIGAEGDRVCVERQEADDFSSLVGWWQYFTGSLLKYILPF